MKKIPEGMTIHLEPPKYTAHTFPQGMLPDDSRAQACWHYYLYAQQSKEKAQPTDDQIVLEGFDWNIKRYREIMEHTAFLYGIDDPSEIVKFWPYVEAEIKRWNDGRGEAQGLPMPNQEYKYVDPHKRTYEETD